MINHYHDIGAFQLEIKNKLLLRILNNKLFSMVTKHICIYYYK